MSRAVFYSVSESFVSTAAIDSRCGTVDLNSATVLVDVNPLM